MKPSQLATELRAVADRIDASKKPSRQLVAQAISTVLSKISAEECAQEECTAQEEMCAVNIPKSVDRYHDEVKKSNPGYSEEQAWATAWSIYCKNKNPDSPHCKS
jgi:hypothetical protein